MLRFARRYSIGTFKLPQINNEPMFNYEPQSPLRQSLKKALGDLESQIKQKIHVPVIVGGKNIETDSISEQLVPQNKQVLCTFNNADRETIQLAIANALEAKKDWEDMHFEDRCAIFLKAADLLSNKYRYDLLAATMLGQGKNAWQAEIDAAAELADFWRFNCQYAAEIYQNQPPKNAPTSWNRTEYRPLEGFVLAYSPFNFTAIGGNLVSAPALMGNVVLWKPSNASIYSNYLVYQILKEAGLPDGVIQFLPADPLVMNEEALLHPEFAGLHFTGSTGVFKHLWKTVGQNLDNYRSFPRLVGETGGKNMHFIHESADIQNAALHTIRGAFEYQGQKCSATSRVYCPDSRYEEFEQILLQEHQKIKMGPVQDFGNHMNAVIHKQSFDKIKKYLDDIKNGTNSTSRILAGGKCDDSVGYFVEPTIVVTKDPQAPTMVDELFGPVVTIYVYPAEEYEQTLELADRTSQYALTGALFAQDRKQLALGQRKLRHAAGNFYVNDKSTGAVVGQQPFGGGRMSGTNDKAGSMLNLLRWVSPRTIKESFVPIQSFGYPSNLAE